MIIQNHICLLEQGVSFVFLCFVSSIKLYFQYRMIKDFLVEP